jgi:hypothetical protein
MNRTTGRPGRNLRQSALQKILAPALFAGAILFVPGAFAEPSKADVGSTIGGGAMARVLPPGEKIKVLEEELAKETDRRVKAEEDGTKCSATNKELMAAVKNASKERAGIELRWSETRDRELALQKVNDRLREENERIAITVRLSLPLVTIVAVGILTMLILGFLYLRRIATRVHSQHTILEMHEIEARLAHANDQYNAELKRNQTLRHKLAELGIVD